jgi:transitional endoplasmic reticulum ATPase
MVPVSVSVKKAGLLARVSAIEDGTIHLRLANGSDATVGPASEIALRVGDVAYVDVEANTITPAPRSVWPESVVLGVVQHVGKDSVVLYSDHRSVIVDLPSFELKVGFTVRFAEVRGIEEVISDVPLGVPSLDIDELVDVSKFRVPASELTDTMADFVGSTMTKRRVRSVVEFPLTRAKLFASIKADKIAGALFYGPPGTGKTMLARIIAKSVGAPLYVIRGSEVSTKWVGSSEQKLRAIFDDARKQPSAIIVLDELDALAPVRGMDTHHHDAKLVSTLLAELDGVTHEGDVFVIGTTNLPQSIDPALLRSSRFHWQIEFPLPNDAERLELLGSKGSHLRLNSDVNMQELVGPTKGWSGDDINGIWREAALLAVADDRGEIRNEDVAEAVRRLTRQHKSRMTAAPGELK